MIHFDVDDIQELSIKYFGDELTEKELFDLAILCNPDKWSKVDDGGREGALAHLIQAVVTIIGLARVDRRGRETC